MESGSQIYTGDKARLGTLLSSLHVTSDLSRQFAGSYLIVVVTTRPGEKPGYVGAVQEE